MSKPYHVYLLENRTGSHYIGLSEDPIRRLDQHNAGFSKWTAKLRPWRIIWTSRRLSLTEARILENKLKRQKGGLGLGALLDVYGS